jgi:hypothetical protein
MAKDRRFGRRAPRKADNAPGRKRKATAMRCCLIGCLLLSVGCHESQSRIGEAKQGPAYFQSRLAPVTWSDEKAGLERRARAGELPETGAPAAGAPAGGGPAGAPAGTLGRRIKYIADIQLAITDFDVAEKKLMDLVRAHDGIFAQSEIAGSKGAPRSGRWRIRVPVEGFQSFLTDVRLLGVPQVAKADSDDVTAEYVDLEARLHNKKTEEETMRGYLKDRKIVAKLEDIFTIEHELVRVRGEIEQMEAQQRLIDNLTALATINIQMHEEKNFIPPQEPTFAAKIRSAFSNSADTLIGSIKASIITIASALPWMPVVVLALGCAWIAGRRIFRLALQLRRTFLPPAPSA